LEQEIGELKKTVFLVGEDAVDYPVFKPVGQCGRKNRMPFCLEKVARKKRAPSCPEKAKRKKSTFHT